jgi:hypothetical protein
LVSNKVHTIGLRRYGALMWSLGKITQTPEVKRVYISSFWVHEFSVREPSVA